ncbi:DNA polymerase Y family protein [Fulvimarina sp. 2208YS6-2-32]|uniref:DNA polymerase Y family protein n=1 Tax=Fulvimarina uroteuthidis TaxID=3098149 RepID=A0ABU5I131_9HYPH|nr:DNA polymerase Y family protein [Fulvimarina sp. 2208YS6-2-32]MDY8109097.1 DNA polymerase Y family protein [Fulvimarina sp. 2208YS6-2-32]
MPKLPTDRIIRDRLGRTWRSDAPAEARMLPLALYQSAANANRITAVCERAEAQGLATGAGLSEARARFPGLETLLAEPSEDRRLLAAIADWCDRYTPLVALDPPFGLILDISGCAHLFGGERALMDDLLMRLFHQGFLARAAIAGSAGTAIALIGVPSQPVVVRAGEERAAVSQLPVSVLRLEPEMASLLHRLGLKTIASLLDQPRAGLARRFGKGLLRVLDEATGLAERPISPRRPVPQLITERRLFEPITLEDDVARVLLALAARMKGDLQARGIGARTMELSLFRVDGVVNRALVAAARPVREPDTVARLFKERLKSLGDELDAGFGYDLVKLCVYETERWDDLQTDLSGKAETGAAFAHLVDRIGARLGARSVLAPCLRDSWQPERAAGWQPVLGAADGGEGPSRTRQGTSEAADAPSIAPRPLRMLVRPEPIEASFAIPDGAPISFRWRRALYRVRKAEGPERIAGEWWHEDRPARDYFRIEDEAGRHFWLFREGARDRDLDPDFVLTTGSAAGSPAWYMHGLFA